MEQRLYGMNSSPLHHHYPQSLSAAYPALHQTFHPHRQGAFSSMYPQGFPGSFPYPGQGQDWSFTGAAAGGLGGLGGNVNGSGLHNAPCGVLAARDPADYLYTQGGAASAMHPRALVSGAQGYCDVVYPGSYSPQDQGHHAFPPSPSQSLSSSPASTDSCDKARNSGDPYQQHDSLFGNSMYLPAENPVFNDPFGTPQPGAYFNDGFVFQDENDRYEQEMEPDYAEPDYDDDMPLPPMDPPHSGGKGSVPKTDKQPQKSTKTTPVPSRETRPAPWDVFGERDSDETSFSDKHTWKTINAVMRLVVAVVFFVIITVTAIVSRLTLLLMTYNVRPGAENFTVARQGRQHVLKEVTGHIDLKWVWALMIVMTAPYIFTAITCLWKIIFKKTEPLRCGPLFAAMTVETLHSLGLCTLVLYVLPSFDPVIGCLMLLNVAFFPGLIQVFQGEQKPQVEIISPQTKDTNTEDGERAEQAKPTNDQSNGQSWRVVRKILDVVMVVLHLGSMFVWSYRAYVIMDDVTLAVLTPVAMLLTSLSFWDNYVSGKKERGDSGKKRTQSTDESAPEDAPKLNGDLNAHTPKDSTNQNNTNTPKKSNFLTVLKRSIKKRRTKITLMTSLWKIILTIVYPALAFGYGSENCLRSFFFFYDIPEPRFIAGQIVKLPLAEKCSLFTSLDFVDEMTCHEYYPLFVAALNVFCSILCYKLAKSACKVLLQIPCFVMPLVLTPPVTLVLLVASYVDPDDFMTVLGCNVPWVNLGKGIHIGEFLEDFTIVYWVPAGFAAYISLLYICGHVWNPRAERMSRTDKLFSKPLYCGVLLDGSLMLNRRRDEDDPAERTLAGQWIDQVHDVGGLELDEARSALRKDTTPVIYICATMWHESETEMIMMLKSVFRLDADQSARKNAQLFFNITDPDYYEFEAHVFFDDAFQAHTDDQFDYAANDFVKQLVRVIDTSASAVHNTDLHIAKPRKIPTPYGGRLVWSLPGGNTLTAHLKDKAKIRHRKRWSQVMYMYYFLGYKLISQERMSLARKMLRADNTYLLALDGDVDFQPEAVQILVDRMKQTPELGAACGRIHPIGSGPMVWYQKFEYAVSHWLQKATEHTLGCVLCSPGCFSLFRGSALMDDNMMKRYTTPPTEARHYVQYDQGEDRWLCTLLLQQGYRVEYCAASDSYTFAPEGFYEFYNQRRRWTPSTMANIIDLLGDWKNTTKNNQDISVLYIIYQLLLLGSGIITPGTIFLLIVGAVANATQDSIPLYAGLILNAIPIFIFVVLCFKADSATQLAYAGVLSIFYTILMMLALVGIIRGAAENGFCSVSTSFLVGVVGVFLVTALLHPMECTAVLHGFLYFVSIPSMSMLLLVYSLANLHVVSWGTREIPFQNLPPGLQPEGYLARKQPVKSAAPPPPQQGQQGGPAGKKPQGSNFITDALSRLADTQNADSDYSFSFGNLFRCLCCPREGAGPNDVKFQTIMQSIEILDSKVTEMTVATSMAGDSLRGVSELPEDSPPASPPLDPPKKFSAVPELFEGAKEKVNPVFEKKTRDELKDPMWAEDGNLGAGAKEFIDDDEKDFWVRLIGQYLFPLDKDDKKEKAVREELLELRNKVSLAFLLTNTLFVVLISSLQIISENTTNLSVEIPCGRNTTFTGEKIEPISVTFTLVFGVMLTLQFLAMLFHRYSTMLHIISITEIKFRKLTRQVLGMQTDSEEEQPTVEETIDLVRVMQAIRPGTPPAEPEADYGEEIDTPVGTAARSRSGGELWGKLNARAKRVTREQTLSRAFMRNFEKLAHQLRAESISENSPVELKAGVNEQFGNLPTRQRHTLLKMAKDDQYKDHILKRSKEAKRRWNRAFAKMRGGKHQFLNLVREAKEVKEEEEEEAKERMAQTAFTSSGGLLSLKSPSPRTSFRRSRGRQQTAAEGGGQFLDPTSPHADYPGYAGGGSPRGSPRHHNRGGSRRSSGAYSGQYDESGPSGV